MKIRFYPIFMLLSIGLLVPLVLSGCSKSNDMTAADADVDYYTCTMHPSVHSKDPGKCPICSMDLVPVKKKGANETKVKENSGGMTHSGPSSMGSE
jgi:Cu(I)/Ag(I) efflux system membrane fusion protein